MQTQQFIGQPSAFANSNVSIDPVLQFGVAYAISGKESADVIKTIAQKLNAPEVDSFASFLSLIERVAEQWQGLFAELSGIYIREGKTLLLAQNGEIWLMRQGKFGRVLKAGEELKVLEGAVKEGDEYVCLTQSAVVALMTHYPQLFDSTTFSLADPAITDTLEQSGLSDRAAALSIQVAALTELPAKRKLPTVSINTVKIRAAFRQVRTMGRKAKQIPQTIRDVVLFIKANPVIRKRLLIGLVVTLIIVLSIGVLTVFRSIELNRVQRELTVFQTQLTAIQSSSNQNVIAARDALLKLQQEFAAAKTDKLSTRFGQGQVAEFERQLSQAVSDLSGKVELQTLPVFFDFGLVKPGFVAAQVSLSVNRAIFVDKEKQQLVSVNLADKQSSDIQIGQYPRLVDQAGFNDQLFLLADGIYQFTPGSNELPKKIIDEGDSNKAAKLLSAYETYIYILNPEKRNIFRYSVASVEATPAPVGWLQDKSGLSFDVLNSMAVDGSLWLTSSDGKVLKYERGNPVEFAITGLGDPFAGQLSLATHPDSDSIFILETGKNRVVRLSKQGAFLQEFKSPQLAAGTDLIFSPEQKKVYVSAGSLVYEIGIE